MLRGADSRDAGGPGGSCAPILQPTVGAMIGAAVRRRRERPAGERAGADPAGETAEEQATSRPPGSGPPPSAFSRVPEGDGD